MREEYVGNLVEVYRDNVEIDCNVKYGDDDTGYNIYCGMCSCEETSRTGNWTGFDCRTPSLGFYGEDGRRKCPGMRDNRPCNGGGTCSWGSVNGVGDEIYTSAQCFCGDVSDTANFSTAPRNLDGDMMFHVSSFGTEIYQDTLEYVLLGNGKLNSETENKCWFPETQTIEYVEEGWNQVGSDLVGDETNINTGYRVQISNDGTVIAVTAYRDDSLDPSNTNCNAGSTTIYEWNDDDWVQLGQKIEGEVCGDYFGDYLALSGDGTVYAAGAAYYDNPDGSNIGLVRIYKYGTNGEWEKIGELTGDGGGNRYGWGLSLNQDGTILAVSSPYMSYSGVARIYDWSGSTWVQRGLNLIGDVGNDMFGMMVQLSSDGDTVAVSAKGHPSVATATRTGYVKVFDWSGTAWEQRGQNIDGEVDGDHSFTIDLSADGNILAFGGKDNDAGSTDASHNVGHVRVFEWTTSWTQRGLDIDGVQMQEQSGYSVSISSSGDTLAVGSPYYDVDGVNNKGRVRVFDWNGTWVERSEIVGGLGNLHKGRSISLSQGGSRLVVGADGFSSNRGRVRVFDYTGAQPPPPMVKRDLSIEECRDYCVANHPSLCIVVDDDGLCTCCEKQCTETYEAKTVVIYNNTCEFYGMDRVAYNQGSAQGIASEGVNEDNVNECEQAAVDLGLPYSSVEYESDETLKVPSYCVVVDESVKINKPYMPQYVLIDGFYLQAFLEDGVCSNEVACVCKEKPRSAAAGTTYDITCAEGLKFPSKTTCEKLGLDYEDNICVENSRPVCVAGDNILTNYNRDDCSCLFGFTGSKCDKSRMMCLFSGEEVYEGDRCICKTDSGDINHRTSDQGCCTLGTYFEQKRYSSFSPLLDFITFPVNPFYTEAFTQVCQPSLTVQQFDNKEEQTLAIHNYVASGEDFILTKSMPCVYEKQVPLYAALHRYNSDSSSDSSSDVSLVIELGDNVDYHRQCLHHCVNNKAASGTGHKGFTLETVLTFEIAEGKACTLDAKRVRPYSGDSGDYANPGTTFDEKVDYCFKACTGDERLVDLSNDQYHDKNFWDSYSPHDMVSFLVASNGRCYCNPIELADENGNCKDSGAYVFTTSYTNYKIVPDHYDCKCETTPAYLEPMTVNQNSERFDIVYPYAKSFAMNDMPCFEDTFGTIVKHADIRSASNFNEQTGLSNTVEKLYWQIMGSDIETVSGVTSKTDCFAACLERQYEGFRVLESTCDCLNGIYLSEFDGDDPYKKYNLASGVFLVPNLYTDKGILDVTTQADGAAECHDLCIQDSTNYLNFGVTEEVPWQPGSEWRCYCLQTKAGLTQETIDMHGPYAFPPHGTTSKYGTEYEIRQPLYKFSELDYDDITFKVTTSNSVLRNPLVCNIDSYLSYGSIPGETCDCPIWGYEPMYYLYDYFDIGFGYCLPGNPDQVCSNDCPSLDDCKTLCSETEGCNAFSFEAGVCIFSSNGCDDDGEWAYTDARPWQRYKNTETAASKNRCCKTGEVLDYSVAIEDRRASKHSCIQSCTSKGKATARPIWKDVFECYCSDTAYDDELSCPHFESDCGSTQYKINYDHEDSDLCTCEGSYMISGNVFSCPSGKYTPEGTCQSSCLTCPVGLFSTPGATSCKQCEAGKIQTGPTTCTDCEAGTFSESGDIECTLCSSGQFSTGGNGFCALCPTGFSIGLQGQSSCDQCPLGWYAAAGASQCKACEAGKYSNDLYVDSCKLCDEGTYQKLTGQTSVSSCLDCPSGWVAITKSSSSCQACAPGQFATYVWRGYSNDFLECGSCVEGRYQDQSGKATCKACPGGKYQNSKGATSCKTCPRGYYSGGHSPGCNDCGAGKYADSTGMSACKSCGYLTSGFTWVKADEGDRVSFEYACDQYKSCTRWTNGLKECHRQVFATTTSSGYGDFRRECCYKDHFWGYSKSCGYYSERNGNRDIGSNSPWTSVKRNHFANDEVRICMPSEYGYAE